MNTIMTELEKDEHEKLLHEEMETCTNCFIVDKVKILALFDDDIGKLNVKLEKATLYHQNKVSEIDMLQAQMKDVVDKFMKKQLLMMSGTEDDSTLELRKFHLMNIDSINFESVNLEQLKALTNKPVKLQNFTSYCNPLTKIELFFTNGFESASYESIKNTTTRAKIEQTWDTSKQIKKIAVKFVNTSEMRGIKFLDEKDTEIVNWDGGPSIPWQPAKEIPAGFEIIGIYGNTTDMGWNVQFGLLIWNPKPSSLN